MHDDAQLEIGFVAGTLIISGVWGKKLSQSVGRLFQICQLGAGGLSSARTSPITPNERFIMRMLLNVKFPHQLFNAAAKDGTAGAKLKRILEAIKPEAAYFTEQDGQRGAVLVVNLPDASKIPALAEPWFVTFQADVEFRVAMTPEDLEKAGLSELGKKWS